MFKRKQTPEQALRTRLHATRDESEQRKWIWKLQDEYFDSLRAPILARIAELRKKLGI